MKEKKSVSALKFIFLVIFMSYTAIFIMVNMGYYDYSAYKRRVFTEEQIKKFEDDIKKGVELDIDQYLTTQESFQSKPKRAGLKLSELIGNVTKKSINEIFKIISKIVEE